MHRHFYDVINVASGVAGVFHHSKNKHVLALGWNDVSARADLQG